MKEELEKIGLELRKWYEKHNEDYVSMTALNGTIMANTSPGKERHLQIYIREEENKC